MVKIIYYAYKRIDGKWKLWDSTQNKHFADEWKKLGFKIVEVEVEVGH